jgi:hypothetical protein
MKAIRRGKLFDKIDCYIVENDDGTIKRMIGVGGIIAAIGAREKGSLKPYLERLPSRYSHLLARAPVEVSVDRDVGGTVARCYDAEYLADVLEAYSESARNGELHHSQFAMADTATRTLCAYARLGLEKHIDAATGYQLKLDKQEIEETLKRIIAYQPVGWSLMWEPDDIAPICDLYGWNYVKGEVMPHQMKSIIDMIHRKAFGDVIIDEIQEINPDPRHGSNHHQHLQPAPRIALKAAIRQSSDLARQCASPEEWRRRLDLHFRRETIARRRVNHAPGQRQSSLWDRLTNFLAP